MLLTIALISVIVNGDEPSVKPVVKIVKGQKVCQKGWECKRFSSHCCNETISDYFQTYQFENLFSKRNSPVAHAVGFWDYSSFITAAAEHQPDGFGTTGGKLSGMKEVAAFLGHVGSKTSCEFKRFCFLIWVITYKSYCFDNNVFEDLVFCWSLGGRFYQYRYKSEDITNLQFGEILHIQ